MQDAMTASSAAALAAAAAAEEAAAIGLPPSAMTEKCVAAATLATASAAQLAAALQSAGSTHILGCHATICSNTGWSNMLGGYYVQHIVRCSSKR